MHLSMDTLGMVDDGCLDNYDMSKGAGSSGGGRVHSIDVILGFNKDQDPLLQHAEEVQNHEVNGGNQEDSEKQVSSDPYRHLSDLGTSTQHSAFDGEWKHTHIHCIVLGNTTTTRITCSVTCGTNLKHVQFSIDGIFCFKINIQTFVILLKDNPSILYSCLSAKIYFPCWLTYR